MKDDGKYEWSPPLPLAPKTLDDLVKAAIDAEYPEEAVPDAESIPRMLSTVVGEALAYYGVKGITPVAYMHPDGSMGVIFEIDSNVDPEEEPDYFEDQQRGDTF